MSLTTVTSAPNSQYSLIIKDMLPATDLTVTVSAYIIGNEAIKINAVRDFDENESVPNTIYDLPINVEVGNDGSFEFKIPTNDTSVLVDNQGKDLKDSSNIALPFKYRCKIVDSSRKIDLSFDAQISTLQSSNITFQDFVESTENVDSSEISTLIIDSLDGNEVNKGASVRAINEKFSEIGEILGSGKDFYGSTAPSGYVFADGQALLRDTYSDLFAVIGTTFGAGDGSTTFNVPDLRGRVSVGEGKGSGLTNRVLGNTGGQESITDVPSHTHTASGTYDVNSSLGDEDENNPNAGVLVNTGAEVFSSSPNDVSPDNTLNISIGSSGSASVDVMNAFLVCNKIIFTGVI